MNLFFDAAGLALLLLILFVYVTRAQLRASPGRAAPLLAALALSLGAALITLLSAPAQLVAGPGVLPGYAPKLNGVNLPQYATPAALSAVSPAYLTSGAEAWVMWQGLWAYAPSCPCSPDGVTCVLAQAGPACWVRSGPWPGAQYVLQWYVDSALGSDSATCQGTGTDACRSPQEIVRRLAGLRAPKGANPQITLAGDFDGGSYTFDFACSISNGYPNGYISINGAETCVGVDGGALYAGKVSSYTAWSTSSEGIAYVINAVDGGPVFDPTVFASSAGYVLQDQVSGVNYLVGTKLDAGTFATPGGSLPGTFSPSEPTVGHLVNVCTLTPVGTSLTSEVGSTPAVTQITGCGLVFNNVQIGPASPYSIDLSTLADGPGSTGFNSSLVSGLLVNSGVAASSFGSGFFSTIVNGGEFNFVVASLFDGITAQGDSKIELSGNDLVGSGGINLGDSNNNQGPAWLQIDTGPSAVVGYTNPCIQTQNGSGATLLTQLLCHNSTGSAVSVRAYRGTSIGYASPVKFIGTTNTNMIEVGGALYDAGPQFNSTNGAGYVVNQ